jgi:Uma2 family endonuclease
MMGPPVLVIVALQKRIPAMRPPQKLAIPKTVAGLLRKLGDIGPERVRLRPYPGTATKEDVTEIHLRTDRLYELVDGILVEKIMGYNEGYLAAWLIRLLGHFLDKHDLGALAGPDATMSLMPQLVRIPDVSFTRWEKFPDGRLPHEPVPDLVPDFAVEILSVGNTWKEMKRKLKDYFFAGVQLVWFVDFRKRTVQVFTAPNRSTVLTEDDTLDGGDVLPGLALSVKEIFSRLPPAEPRPAKSPRRPNGKGPKRRRPS